MSWLITEWHLIGVPIQNWMWVVGGGVLLYVCILIIAPHVRRMIGRAQAD